MGLSCSKNTSDVIPEKNNINNNNINNINVTDKNDDDIREDMLTNYINIINNIQPLTQQMILNITRMDDQDKSLIIFTFNNTIQYIQPFIQNYIQS